MKNAILIVASPFQLMNMKAALSYFNIKEYKLYIIKDSESDRHDHIVDQLLLGSGPRCILQLRCQL